jgi:transposase
MSRDIVCPKCCEPCEIDTLHEYVAEVVDLMPAAAASVSFASVYETFTTDGFAAACEDLEQLGGW